MIEEIRARFRSAEYEFSLHAVDQMLLREIAVSEVSEAVAVGEIIEEYAGDKYGPSCLIFGRTAAGRPLHVHCTFPSRPVMKVITSYVPDASKWEEDFRKRRRHDL